MPQSKNNRGDEPPWRDRDVLTELYHRQNLSQREVAEELGCSRGAIKKWMKRLNVPRNRKPMLNVSLSPSEPLMYILGVGLGDGCVVHQNASNQYYFKLTTSAKPFAHSTAEAIDELGISAWRGKDRGYYVVKGYSKTLYYFIKGFKHDPEMILDYCETAQHRFAFVKGFYESEGFDLGEGRGLEMYNTEVDLLNVVIDILKEDHIESWISYVQKEDMERKSVYVLLVTASDKERFLYNVDPVIKRQDKNPTPDMKLSEFG